ILHILWPAWVPPVIMGGEPGVGGILDLSNFGQRLPKIEALATKDEHGRIRIKNTMNITHLKADLLKAIDREDGHIDHIHAMRTEEPLLKPFIVMLEMMAKGAVLNKKIVTDTEFGSELRSSCKTLGN